MGKTKRNPGDGTLRLRKDGRWEGRVVIGYDEKGLPKTKNVTSYSEAECKEKLEKLKEECGSIRHKVSPDMPFGEWIDLWYQTYSKNTLRRSTREGYESHIYKHIIPEIGNIPLDKLSQTDIHQFCINLKKNGRLHNTDRFGAGLSDRSVRGCFAVCRSALDRAEKDGLIESNPTEGCRQPPKKAKEMQVLTTSEMRRLLIQAKEDGCYEMVILELSTGLRRGEIAALKWEDIDFSTGNIRIDKQLYPEKGEQLLIDPKTKASVRTLILPPQVINVLSEYRRNRIPQSEWVFASPRDPDRAYTPSAIYRKIQKSLERAGCKVIRFHDLRHTFATTALEHGMDIKMLSTIIGHTSSATTIDIYSHVTDGMQLQAANKIEKGFGRNEQYADGEVHVPEQKNSDCPSEPFKPHKGEKRKPGTGCLYQVNDHLWEGSYHPTNVDGKREGHTVYAKTREDCENLLETMIEEVKARINAEKEARRAKAAS